MAEQQPASEQMRRFFSMAVDTIHTALELFPPSSPSALMHPTLAAQMEQLAEAKEALYARMQAEEQERAAMRALLERFTSHEQDGLYMVRLVDMAGDRRCGFCGGWERVQGGLSTFGHYPACPIPEARALLAKMETGKDSSDE